MVDEANLKDETAENSGRDEISRKKKSSRQDKMREDIRSGAPVTVKDVAEVVGQARVYRVASMIVTVTRDVRAGDVIHFADDAGDFFEVATSEALEAGESMEVILPPPDKPVARRVSQGVPVTASSVVSWMDAPSLKHGGTVLGGLLLGGAVIETGSNLADNLMHLNDSPMS